MNILITTALTPNYILNTELKLMQKSRDIYSPNIDILLHTPELTNNDFEFPYDTRCGYEMKSLDYDADFLSKYDWVVRCDCDVLFLQDLYESLDGFDKSKDMFLVPENRRFLGGNDHRLMKKLSNVSEFEHIDIEPMDYTIKSLEDNENMYPIFQCGIQIINGKVFNRFNLFMEWNYLNYIVEKYYGTFHSLELAWSILIQKLHLDIEIIDDSFNWNPISHWRDGKFPEQKLKDICILPEDIKMFHYHKQYWLKYFINDKRIKKIIESIDIDNDFWDSKPY